MPCDYTEQSMILAIAEVSSGSGVRKATQKYNILYTILSDWVNRGDNTTSALQPYPHLQDLAKKYKEKSVTWNKVTTQHKFQSLTQKKL